MALPIPKIFRPVTVVPGDRDEMLFTFDQEPDRTATIAPGTYDTPEAWCTAVDDALSAMEGLAGITVVIAEDGRFVFTCAVGRTMYIRPRAGSHWVRLGFVAGNGLTDEAVFGQTPTTAPNLHDSGWYPPEPVADDTRDLPVYERRQRRSLAGNVKGLTFATRYERRISFELLPGRFVFKADEVISGESLERLFDEWGTFRYYPDGVTSAGVYTFDLETAKELPRRRVSRGLALYSVDLKLLKVG